MADKTEISWADATFNPWVGCTKVSPACDGCYAQHLIETRHHRAVWGGPGIGEGTRDRTSESNWAKPLAWNREAAKSGRTRFVFCSSLADVFDNAVPVEWRRDLFDLIRRTPALTWLLLTKRPGNIVKLFCEALFLQDDPCFHGYAPAEYWPRNAAFGFSSPNQKEFDRDWAKMLETADTLNPPFIFMSAEPLLGPIDMGPISALKGRFWVIAGGETDQGKHRARPSHPDWFRSLRDQCAAAGVPFHFKQWGSWLPFPYESPCVSRDDLTGSLVVRTDGHVYKMDDVVAWTPAPVVVAAKVGKKIAGRTLDGVIHDARPQVRHG